jgi:hypothetical protein
MQFPHVPIQIHNYDIVIITTGFNVDDADIDSMFEMT